MKLSVTFGTYSMDVILSEAGSELQMINSASLATLDGLWPAPAPVALERVAPAAYGADVIRTISVSPAVVGRRLADGTLWSPGTSFSLGGLGDLVIEGPWLLAPWSGLPGWRTSGRLRRKGRLDRAYGRIDVELVPWSPTTTGLRVARRSPLPVYWSARRVRRYWATAHAAADRLAGLDLSPAA